MNGFLLAITLLFSEPASVIIPRGAIKAPCPPVLQPANYDCGASAVASVLAKFGVGEVDYYTLRRKLGSTRKNGTDYNKMAEYMKSVGLKVKIIKGMDALELQEKLDIGRPVICSIQAYGDPKDYAKDENGHFVVAVGYDAERVYFVDPGTAGRFTFLVKPEFSKRWHDNEGTEKHPDVITHLGIVVWFEGPVQEKAWHID